MNNRMTRQDSGSEIPHWAAEASGYFAVGQAGH